MSSNLNKDLDELDKRLETSPEMEEEPKQEPDTSDETEIESEPAPEEGGEELPPEGEMEEPIGLNTDEIDYPDDDEETQDMDVEAEKLPDISQIVSGGEGSDEDETEGDEEEQGEEEGLKLNDKLLGLKEKSISGIIETISSQFIESHPEHDVCCVMKDKVISLKNGHAFETGFSSKDGGVQFNSPIRNQELEENKKRNDAIIAKLLKTDNI